MPSKQEIVDLLERLNDVPAAELEDQRLDFKEWDRKSYKDSAGKILETVICMANGGGGTVVVGVNDKKVGAPARGRRRARRPGRQPVEAQHLRWQRSQADADHRGAGRFLREPGG